MKKSILTILLSAITCAAFSQWYWSNPLPSGYMLFDVDFINTTTGYVIGEKGTLMKTTDAGESWEFIPTGTFADFRKMCFTSENTGYASTLDAHLLKTTDGGYSWQILATDTLEEIFDIFFLNENTGFIAADHGNLLRTVDGGLTWDRALVNQYLDITSVFFVNDYIGYATSKIGRYYKTTDGGDSWVMNIEPAWMDLYDVYFVDLNNGFISGRDGFFMRTTNGGNTWTSSNCGCEVREMHFINGTTGYAINEQLLGDTYLVKTTNAGNSWVQVGMENIEAFEFINQNTIIGSGRMGRLLKSTNAGSTYTNYTTAATYANFADIHFPSFQTGYAVGYFGEIVKTSNAGDTWQLLPQGPSLRLNSIWFTSENTGFVTGDSSIYQTTDGGYTWRKLPISFPAWMTDLFFVNETIGYVIGEATGVVYKTTDGGETWNLVYEHEYKSPRSLYFINADTGYVALETSILKTIDGGIQWTETELSNTEYVLIMDMFFPTPEIGYAGGFGGKIYKTIDGGSTWVEQYFSQATYHTITSVWFIDQYKGFIGGDGSGFFQTADGGNTWTKIEYMTGFHDAMWFTNSSTGYLAGSYGKIMRTFNAGAVPVIAPVKPELNIRIYPNPACDEIVISGLQTGAKTEISIFTSNGKCLADRIVLPQSGKLDVSSYQPGLYIVFFKTGNRLESRKLMKL